MNFSYLMHEFQNNLPKLAKLSFCHKWKRPLTPKPFLPNLCFFSFSFLHRTPRTTVQMGLEKKKWERINGGPVFELESATINYLPIWGSSPKENAPGK